MPAKDERKPRRGCRRVFIWLVVLSLVVIGTISAILTTGVPQRLGVQYALTNVLKADVGMKSVQLRSPLIIQALTLAESPASLYAPLVHVDTLAIGYRWQPDVARHLKSVTLSGARISVQGGESANNYQFLQDFLFTPSENPIDPAPWIPEELRIDDLWAEAKFPGYYLRMDHLRASAALYGLDRGALELRSEDLGLAWESHLVPGGTQSHAGQLAIDLNWDAGAVNALADVDFGRLAQLNGSFALMDRDGAPYIDVSIPSAKLDDPLWSAILLEHLPTPIQFDTLTVSDVRIGIHRPESGLVIDAAELDGHVGTITIGPESQPYYSGPLAVSLHGKYGEQTTIAGEVTLSESMAFSGDMALKDGGVHGSFSLPPWPRGVIEAFVPPDYASVLAILAPLDTLGATGTVEQGPEGISATADLSASFGGEAVPTIPVNFSMTPSPEGQQLKVTSAITLSESTVITTVSGPAGASLQIDNTLKDVSINDWTQTLLGKTVVPGLGGTFRGTANVTLPTDAPLDVALAVLGSGVRYGDLALEASIPLHVDGTVRYDIAAGKASGKKLHFVQEEAIDLTAENWAVATSTGNVKAALQSQLSLTALASVFQLSNLYGNAQIDGKLAVDTKGVRFDSFSAQSEDLIYGTDEWGVPYGSTLFLDGSLAYDYTKRLLSFEPIEARLDEGTTVSLGTWALQMPGETQPFTMTAAPLRVESDMAILMALNYVSEVLEGKATISSESLVWDGTTLASDIHWDVAAAQLVLPDELATIEALATSGAWDMGSDTDGSGEVAATRVDLYGMPFGAMRSQLAVNSSRLSCAGLETTFLGGDITLDAAVNYRDPTWLTSAALRVAGIDLAEFTKTFEPPDIILTGIVHGTANVTLTTEGLQALDIDLTASENLTLNRSMVRQILMSQYVNDAVGSKSVQRVIEKVIGDDEQRPFDDATLNLGLKDGFIVGVARLESSSLDVTVDINADPAAILEAIRSSTKDGS